MGSPWTRSALRSALITTALASVVALSAGAVRLFPWLLDPSVTWRVATPFARSLAIVALEVALAVGWPLGWALAAVGWVERGEARVLRLLGERPLRTAARLSGQGVAFAVVLAALAFAAARESTEPGRIVSELIADGQAACARVEAPATYTVPFFGATWLCEPGVAPRLVGQGPGPLRTRALVYTARGAVASGDLGRIDLDDVQIALPAARLHVGAVTLRGTAPFGHASAVAPLVRARALPLGVSLSALASVALILSGRTRGTLAAMVVAASGPLLALGLLRLAAHLPASDLAISLAIPSTSLAVPLMLSWVEARLPALWHAASR